METVKYKVRFSIFGNFSSHKILEIPTYLLTHDNLTKMTAKLILYNMIKDETWDWPLTYDDLSIDKINVIDYYRCQDTDCGRVVAKDKRMEIPSTDNERTLYKCPKCRGRLEKI